MRFGFKPIPTQPVRYEADRLRVEDFFVAEGGHPIVALAVIADVARISDEPNEPLTRAVTGKIRAGGVFIFVLKLVTIDAGGTFFQEIATFVDQLQIILVGKMLDL